MTTKNYWQRFRRQRISRRRLLASTGLGAAGLTVAAACGGDDEEPGPTGTPAAGETPAVAGAPKRGGTYKGLTQGDWGTIDPVTSVGNSTGITPRMHNVLLNRSNANPDFWFFDLAESLEQPDDVTYVWKLRRGVKIAPNNLGIPERDMDASDVMSRKERIYADEDALARVVYLPWVESEEAPDAQTVINKTKGPYGYFISRQGRALGGCIPPREFYEQGISLEDQGVGGGPYVMRPGSYRETGQIILDRNTNYYRKDEFGEQLPYIDVREVVPFTERQAWRTAFLDAQVYNYTAESGAEADEIMRQDSDVYKILNPVFTFISFTMNPFSKPWDDDRIRKAATFALNRKQFIDLVVGEGGGKPNGLVHWSTGRYGFNEEELEELQPYDPQRSRELIRAATGQDTVRVKITYPVTTIEFHDKHLPIFLQQMREAGFDIEEDAKDFGTWLGDYTRVRYDASLSPNQIYETPEIALDWQSSKGPQGDENFAVGVGALYPEIDEAIMASKRETDPEKQIEAVRDAQRLVYEKGPSFLPIFTWQDHVLYRNFVKNVPVALADTGTFLNEEWLDL
jgi:ABC-type transport system substrate-binding protein